MNLLDFIQRIKLSMDFAKLDDASCHRFTDFGQQRQFWPSRAVEVDAQLDFPRLEWPLNIDPFFAPRVPQYGCRQHHDDAQRENRGSRNLLAIR